MSRIDPFAPLSRTQPLGTFAGAQAQQLTLQNLRRQGITADLAIQEKLQQQQIAEAVRQIFRQGLPEKDTVTALRSVDPKIANEYQGSLVARDRSIADMNEDARKQKAAEAAQHAQDMDAILRFQPERRAEAAARLKYEGPLDDDMLMLERNHALGYQEATNRMNAEIAQANAELAQTNARRPTTFGPTSISPTGMLQQGYQQLNPQGTGFQFGTQELGQPEPKASTETPHTVTTDRGVMQWNPATKRFDIKVGNRPPGAVNTGMEEMRTFQRANALRDDYSKEVTPLQTRADSYDFINSVREGRAGSPDDIVLIYNFVKMQDPNAVREGELQLVQSGAAIPDTWKRYVSQFGINNQTGTALVLGPQQRRAMIQSADNLYRSAILPKINAINKRYTDSARRSRVDPADVVRPDRGAPGAPPAGTGGLEFDGFRFPNQKALDEYKRKTGQ